MLLIISRFGATTIDLIKHPGKLAVELDMNMIPNSRVVYCGPEGYFPGDVELQPISTEEGVGTWFLDPPSSAPENQVRRHRYLLQYPGGDNYVAHPAYRNLTLIEHHPECWELCVEGIKARIVMPMDFRAPEAVMES
jgi:hypothetical protein